MAVEKSAGSGNPHARKKTNDYMKEYMEMVKTEHLQEVGYRNLGYLIDVEAKGITYTINNGGESYTDGKRIVVSMPECFLNPASKKYWKVITKALAAHEAQHKNSSSFTLFKDIQKWYGEYLEKHHQMPVSVGQGIARWAMNVLEDGRIEAIVCRKMAVYTTLFQLLNGGIRKWNAIEKGDKTKKDEYNDFSRQVLSYAKTGKNAIGISHYKGKRMQKEFAKVRGCIDDAVNGVTCQDCYEATKRFLITATPYIVELIQEDVAIMQMLQQLANAISEWNNDPDGEEERNDRSSGSSLGAVRLRKQSKKTSQDDDEQDSDKSTDESRKQAGSGSGMKKDDNDDDAKTAGGDGAETNEDGDEKASGSKSVGDEEDAEDEQKGTGSGKDKEDGEDGEDGASDNNKDKSENGNDDKDNKEGEEKEGEDKEDKSKDENEGNESKDDAENSKNGDDNKRQESKDAQFEPVMTFDEDDTYPGYTEDELQKLLDQMDKECEWTTKDEQRKNLNHSAKKLQGVKTRNIDAHYSYPVAFNESRIRLTSEATPADIRLMGKKIKKELELILTSRQREKRGVRHGALDNRSLWRSACGSDNIFYRKGEPHIDCAIFALVDNSGSMFGQKELAARKTLAVIEESLPNGVATKFVLFNGGYHDVQHDVIKEWDDRGNARNFSHNSLNRRSSNGNFDGYSIRVATAQILERQERKKVLLVLSDGLPSAYKDEQIGIDDVKAAVAEAKQKGVMVIPIMFGEEYFVKHNIDKYNYMYGDKVIACSQNTIMKEFTALFKQIILHR